MKFYQLFTLMVVLNRIQSLRMPPSIIPNTIGGNCPLVIHSVSITSALDQSYSTEAYLKKKDLYELVNQCQPNGIDAQPSTRVEINSIIASLEKLNPTTTPALSEKMNGFWRMDYTDFSPPATSSGKLGPFIGEVYQDLYGSNQTSTAGIIKNILRIKFPPIIGALVAKQRIVADDTWSIEFDRLSNKVAGLIQLPIVAFPPGSQLRLWQITYLDDDLRIMRAGRLPLRRDESFIFIFRRLPDSDRIVVDI